VEIKIKEYIMITAKIKLMNDVEETSSFENKESAMKWIESKNEIKILDSWFIDTDWTDVVTNISQPEIKILYV
jgi:hypothetical protein